MLNITTALQTICLLSSQNLYHINNCHKIKRKYFVEMCNVRSICRILKSVYITSPDNAQQYYNVTFYYTYITKQDANNPRLLTCVVKYRHTCLSDENILLKIRNLSVICRVLMSVSTSLICSKQNCFSRHQFNHCRRVFYLIRIFDTLTFLNKLI